MLRAPGSAADPVWPGEERDPPHPKPILRFTVLAHCFMPQAAHSPPAPPLPCPPLLNPPTGPPGCLPAPPARLHRRLRLRLLARLLAQLRRVSRHHPHLLRQRAGRQEGGREGGREGGGMGNGNLGLGSEGSQQPGEGATESVSPPSHLWTHTHNRSALASLPSP